ANPKWSARHVRYAYEMMPTSNASFYAKGTRERKYWEEYFMWEWTQWAIEMNLLPDDTQVPPKPDKDGSLVLVSRRRAAIPDSTNPVANMPVAPPGAPGRQAPKPGTVASRIWAIADQETARLGRQATIEEVLVVARTQNLNEGNTKTEFSSWRKYH